MNSRPLFFFIAALAATSLQAQDKKPPAPKTPVHSPAQSKLNEARQDERVQKGLQKAKELIDNAGKNSEAAKREAERLQKTKSAPTPDEAKEKFEKLKNNVDEKSRKELEALLKDSTGAVKEELKNLLEQKRKENGPAPAVNPVPEIAPPPAGFEAITTLDPIPLQKGPLFTPAPIRADHAIKGPSRDPKNPDKQLPESDPRTRTWVLNGNVTLRRPTEVIDADEVEIVFKQGESPESNKEKKKKPAAPPGVDPINRPKNEDSAIESIVARGRVRFMIVDSTGRVQVGRGGHMTWESKTGWFVIKDWPEAEFRGLLLKGRTRNSVIRLSRLEEVDMSGLDFYTLERELTPNDLPKTAKEPVPNAGPVLPKPSQAPSPAPR